MTHTPDDPNGPSIMDRAELPPQNGDGDNASAPAPAPAQPPHTATSQMRPEGFETRQRILGAARRFLNELSAQFGEHSFEVSRVTGILLSFSNQQITKSAAFTRIVAVLHDHDRLKQSLLELFQHDGIPYTANDFDLAQLHPRFMQPAHQPSYGYLSSNPYGFHGTSANQNTGNGSVQQQYYGLLQHTPQPYYQPTDGSGYGEPVAAQAFAPTITDQDSQDSQKAAGEVSSPTNKQEDVLHQQQATSRAPMPNIAQPLGQYALQNPNGQASAVNTHQGVQYAQQTHKHHVLPAMSQFPDQAVYENTGRDTPPRTPLMGNAAPMMYKTEYNAYSSTDNWPHPNLLPVLAQAPQDPVQGYYNGNYTTYPHQPTAVHQQPMAQAVPAENPQNVVAKESSHSSARTSPQAQRTSVTELPVAPKTTKTKARKAPTPAATEANFVHSLCGKAFASRSKVKKHHWGAKLNDLETKTGCWAKYKKPANVEWDDHPSCKQDPSDAPLPRAAPSLATAPLTATGPTSSTPKNRLGSNNRNLLPSVPTLQHLPNTVEALVHRRPSSASPFSNSVPFNDTMPYHTHAMPSHSSMSTLLAAVDVAARVDAPQPQSRHDSIVAQLQAAASDLGQKSPEMPTPALAATATYASGPTNSYSMLYPDEFIGVSIPADVRQDNIVPAVATEDHINGNLKREQSPAGLLHPDQKPKRPRL